MARKPAEDIEEDTVESVDEDIEDDEDDEDEEVEVPKKPKKGKTPKAVFVPRAVSEFEMLNVINDKLDILLALMQQKKK